MEEYAYILDFIPAGTGLSKKGPVCYALGENEFKLFELVPKADVQIKFKDRVYIGKDANLRKEIDHVKRRIAYNELTNIAESNIEDIVTDIVNKDQSRFIRFYNETGPVAPKKHGLEELPGLGKKMMYEVLDARDVRKFADFNDIKTRVPVIKDPVKLIVNRIVLELSDDERRRYYFVVKNEPRQQ